jgi:dTDP-4-dehydrorhamnose reductase
MNKKILILGSNGMAGSMISSYLEDKHYVTSFSRKDFDCVKDAFPAIYSFDYVINCIGLIKQKSNDSESLNKINSLFVHDLAHACSCQGAKLIHLSSDCVFSGDLDPKLSYNTSDIKDAKDDYGKSKSRGESKLAMVLRTSIIGPSSDQFGLFEWFRNTAQNTVNGFNNHLWSGITTLELAKIIDKIISNDLHQNIILQIAGTNISKYDLLSLINNIFKLNKNINKCDAEIIVNRSLVGDYKAQDIEKQLIELRDYEAC